MSEIDIPTQRLACRNSLDETIDTLLGLGIAPAYIIEALAAGAVRVSSLQAIRRSRNSTTNDDTPA